MEGKVEIQGKTESVNIYGRRMNFRWENKKSGEMMKEEKRLDGKAWKDNEKMQITE